MPYIGKPQSSDPITVNNSNIEDGTIIAADISSSLGNVISGSLGSNASVIRTLDRTTLSGSLGANAAVIRSLDRTTLSGSLGSNAAIIRSLDRTTISGSIPQALSTTSSPTFNNITATGTLTAQEIHTEFTSASILFTSGSTIFGNSSDDVHNMTGSLNVSGSLTLNDGTLTVTDNVDFNGDLDVDGTTNLDAVDIDGDVDLAGVLTVAGSTSSNYVGSFTNTSAQGWGLFVKGGADNADYTLRVQDKDAGDLLSVKAGGYIGIGTNDPSTGLHLSGGNNTASKLTLTNTAPSPDNSWSLHPEYNSQNLTLSEDSTTRITFQSGGNVGIGTDSPNTALHLKFTDNTTNATDNSSLTHSSGIYINNESTTNEAHSSVGFRTNNLDGALSMIYGGSANTGRMSVNMEGAERLVVTHDGKVCIGTSSPLAKFDVRNSTETITLNTSAGALFESIPPDANNGTYLFGDGSGDSDRPQILAVNSDDTIATGNWSGIGFGVKYHSSANIIVTLAGIAGVKENATDGSGGDNGALAFGTRPNGDYIKERMRITSAGTVHIKAANPNTTEDAVLYVSKTGENDWSQALIAGSDDYGLKINGGGSYAIMVTDHDQSGAATFRVHYNGTIYSSNTSVQSISDRRLKENIVDANSQWNDIKGLKFKNFNWKESTGRDTSITYLGLIADEVESVSPNLVEIDAQPKEDIETGVTDPEYKNVKYSIVWMKAVKALQEAMEKIETLETQMAQVSGSS